MKKYLIFLVLILSHFSVNAEGVKLSCIPNEPVCQNCSNFQTLFPLEEFSTNTESLDIEADESEILDGTYLLNGDVEINSESLYLAADNVEVSSINDEILATGNVRFQDEAYLISSDLLSATRDKDENLITTATNANYQEYVTGLGGANGNTESIYKTSSNVLLKNTTYSLCPVNENDWLIEADQINLNIDNNRGNANNAIIKFYGVPIFYAPKYSWVISGRGSGFLTPNYSSYAENGATENSSSLRVPYYFNLGPDHDLLVALTAMSSRGLTYEGKYRKLIAPKISPDHEDSIWSIETRYLPKDKITKLKRWLINFSEDLDVNHKTHLSAQYFRVSDAQYFNEIALTSIDDKTLKSFLKLSFKDADEDLSLEILTEDEQVVNGGAPVYTRALEGSVSKTFNADSKTPINFTLTATKFEHDTESKESGLRTHSDLGISRELNIEYPKITPNASVAITKYSLKNSPNINRTIFGTGLDIDFTTINNSQLFGYNVYHTISPLITYNYRAKKVQGNIPLFDSTDKYDDIISFSDLTSGERYTGLDRITNANDITLSLQSNYRKVTALKNDKDLLSLKVAQTYYTDDEVVSDTSNTNYETRRSYSDIAASIDTSLGKYTISNSAQFDPKKSKIVKRENSITYKSNDKKFITLSLSDQGTVETKKLYGSYPITDSIHFFGGLDKTTSTGITNSETTGLAYESCCWAFRVAHFKTHNGGTNYNYSTGFELVLKGLGSTASPLRQKIENNIPGYSAKLR